MSDEDPKDLTADEVAERLLKAALTGRNITVDPEVCPHPNLPPVEFDAEAARDMDAWEVKKRWPRLTQACPDCGTRMIMYASWEHYIAGDW